MNKNTLIGAIIGLVAGAVVTVGVIALVNTSNNAVSTTNMSSMTMSEMNTDLKAKTGDDFDKAFLSMMIEHHKGAVEMANLASANAEHDEIKTLSKGIVTAQNDEISKMRQWQMDWGYLDTSEHMPGMNH